LIAAATDPQHFILAIFLDPDAVISVFGNEANVAPNSDKVKDSNRCRRCEPVEKSSNSTEEAEATVAED